MTVAAGLALLAACSGQSSPPQSQAEPPPPPPTAQSSALQGGVYGGRQPIVGATVVAYAAGTTTGAVATEIGSGVTDSSGHFDITFNPTPANGQVVYLTAAGGDAGSGVNGAIELMTVAGAYCDPGTDPDCTFPATANMDELTTVAATAALQAYLQFVNCTTLNNNSQTGTCADLPGATGLAGMAATVNRLVNVVTGRASDFLVGQGAGAPLHATLEKLDTLADVLASCVNSSAPDSAACSGLASASLAAPNTLDAAFAIAAWPGITARGAQLFGLLTSPAVYTPVLAAAPATFASAFWTVGGERYAYTANFLDNVSGYTFGAGPGGALAPVTGAPFTAGSDPGAAAMDPMGPYVYVVNNDGDNVSAYTIGADGTLTPVAGSPFAAGVDPTSVAVDPTGHYVYVVNNNSGNSGSVSAYTIGTDGGLTPLAGSPFAAGVNTSSVAVDPTGRYVYVTNECGSNPECLSGTVSEHLIGAGGTLTLYENLSTGNYSFPSSVAVDPTGRYVYVTNACPIVCSGSVAAYTIGTEGMLTLVTGSPFAVGSEPVSVTVDPTGRYVYVANFSSNNVSAYTIGPSGSLTPVAGSPFGAGREPTTITVDPTGRYVYVTNRNDNNVSAYTIGASGALTPIGAFTTGIQPQSVAVDPAGPYLYVTNYGSNTVSEYTIDSGEGLTPIGTEGTNIEPWAVAVDPSGRYVRVTDYLNNLVPSYAIGTDGTLTPAPGFTCPGGVGPPDNCIGTGKTPYAVAVDPTSRYVYVANLNGNSVYGYAIHATGGLAVVDFSSGVVAPQGITVDPTGRYVYVATGTITEFLIDAGGVLTPLGSVGPNLQADSIVIGP